MGRAFAGVLGFTAFATVVARGVIDGQETAAIMTRACLALAAFGTLGAVAGLIGDAAVRESVEQNLRAEIEQRQRAASEN
jgi:hypothetical protein